LYSIRLANVSDAAALAEIYKPFVISDDLSVSSVSFEYEAPDAEEFARRIMNISKDFPYLVLLEDNEPIGYAYAHPFIERAAYQWGAEVTIYLDPAGQGKGLGVVLYKALEDLLRLQNVIHLYSCVTSSNEHSVGMHQRIGYKIVGHFAKTGFKKGTWLDMVWLEKEIAPFPKEPELRKSFSSVNQEQVSEILANYNNSLAKR